MINHCKIKVFTHHLKSRRWDVIILYTPILDTLCIKRAHNPILISNGLNPRDYYAIIHKDNISIIYILYHLKPSTYDIVLSSISHYFVFVKTQNLIFIVSAKEKNK